MNLQIRITRLKKLINGGRIDKAQKFADAYVSRNCLEQDSECLNAFHRLALKTDCFEAHVMPEDGDDLEFIDCLNQCEASERYYISDGDFVTVTCRNRDIRCHEDHVESVAFSDYEGNWWHSDHYTAVEVDGETVCLEHGRDNYYIHYWESDDSYHFEEEPDFDKLGRQDYGAGSNSPIKKGESFSLELEVYVQEVKSCFGDELRKIADRVEKDGSLDDDHGAEIIFGSASLEELKDIIPRVCKKLQEFKCIGYDAGTNYGNHISIDRNYWNISVAHLARIILLVDSNKGFFEKIAQRKENQWCSYTASNPSSALKKIKSKEKREAVAIRSDRRVEFRLFRSSVRPERLLKNVETVKAIIDYTRKVFNHKSLSISDFRQFISNNSKSYSNLASFIKEKGL